MNPAYTDKTAVQNYTLTNIDASFDTQLTAYIAAMSEFANTRAGYPIYRTAPSTNTYDGNGESHLPISPVVSITEVQVDGAVVTPLQAPYNASYKTELILPGQCFTNDYANVTVTGIHAFSATLPEKIKWAVTVLVAGIVNQVNNQTEGVQSEKIGEYQVSYKDQAQRADYTLALKIIDSYRRVMF